MAASPTLDQLTQLTQMIVKQQELMKAQSDQLTEQTRLMKEQETQIQALTAKLQIVDAMNDTLVKVEADLSDAQGGSPGATSGAAASSSGSGGSVSAGAGVGNGTAGGNSAGLGSANSGGVKGNPLTVKFDSCPKMGKEQNMSEWTRSVTRWEKGVPVILRDGLGRERLHNAIEVALEHRPKVKTQWSRLLAAKEKIVEEGGDMPPLADLVVELKDKVVHEEKLIARETFKGRDKVDEENFSEYNLVLKAEGAIGYEGLSDEELDEKVLERFLDGIGKAGESVRLQAPKTIEEAIAKAIAYENEQKRNKKEKERVYAFARKPFKGACFKCKQHGHKAHECPNVPNAEPRDETRPKETRSCYVCKEVGHIAKDCPQRK